MRAILLILFFLATLNAEDITRTPPILATVINVPKGDVLNIRARPNYRAKKIGFLRNNEDVEVLKCIRVGSKSKWCKIEMYGFTEYAGFTDEARVGWVNAKYLRPVYSTYVDVEINDPDAQGGNCEYSLSCRNGVCKVYNGTKIHKVKRSKLRAFFPFGGHCRHINLDKLDKLQSSKKAARRVYKALKNCNVSKFKRYIHPKKGILITYNTNFYRTTKHLSRYEFSRYYRSYKKFLLGVHDGSGDNVYLTLKRYCKILSRAARKARLITKKASAKESGFPHARNAVAYYAKESQPNPGWKGVLLVLEKYKGKWYLVGLAYYRWTI